MKKSRKNAVLRQLRQLRNDLVGKLKTSPGDRELTDLLRIVQKEIRDITPMTEAGFLPICRRYYAHIATAILILLFSLKAFAQGYDTSQLQKVDAYTVTSWSFASCQNEFDTIYTLPELPTMIRSRAVGSVYEFTEFIPFRVYWTPWERPLDFDQSYHISSGRCRGFSFSLAAKCPGIYTIVFGHQTKPCVMQIAVTPKDMHSDAHLVELRFFQRCQPEVIFRRYEAKTVYMDLPPGQPLDIEVHWKPDDGREDFGPSKGGFELLKTVRSNTGYRFKYVLPKYGVYRFRMKSPADRHYFYDFVRLRPDGHVQCGAVSLD